MRGATTDHDEHSATPRNDSANTSTAALQEHHRTGRNITDWSHRFFAAFRFTAVGHRMACTSHHAVRAVHFSGREAM